MSEITLIDPTGESFDLFVGCVGYEHRSLAALRKMKSTNFDGNSILFDYRSGELFSYEDNLKDSALATSELRSSFQEFERLVEEFFITNDRISVILDVTSLDREKIALLLQLFFAIGLKSK